MMKRWDIKEGHTLFLHIVWTILLSYFVAGLLGTDNNRPPGKDPLFTERQVHLGRMRDLSGS